MTKQPKPVEKKTCDYENCTQPVFATEGLTGMNGKLCMKHTQRLFGRLIANAEIVEELKHEAN